MTIKTDNQNTLSDQENNFNTVHSTLKNKEIPATGINDVILARQDNRYYIINGSTSIHYPALNGVICFYISHRHQSVMLRMTTAHLILPTQLSRMEAESDILLAGAAHFCHGRMTSWYLSDKYSSQNEFNMSILKSPSINYLLPLHLIR